ncbi:MAG: hypothetical protein ACRBBW_18490 [Cellvibrionaceae bacterium]
MKAKRNRVVALIFGCSALIAILSLISYNLGNKKISIDAIDTTLTRTIKTEKNLAQCIQQLESKDGGWCELAVKGKKPSISNVFPAKQRRVQLSLGPKAVLTAWSSAAWDKVNRDLYFMGGGGHDYGGNEIYRFALNSGTWTRLTTPSPPNHWTRTKHAFWIPDTRKVPAASYLNDGLLFNEKTQTLLVLANSAANGAKLTDQAQPEDTRLLAQGAMPQQYEFNPSPQEMRNGLSPLSWRRVGTEPWGMPRSLQLPDGSLILGSKDELFRTQQSEQGLFASPRLLHKDRKSRGGNAIYDRYRKWIWTLYLDSLVVIDKQGNTKIDAKLPMKTSRSLAFNNDGLLVSWDGASRIYEFNPDRHDAQWRVINWRNKGPYNGDRGRVFGKWVHLYDNFFAGISTHDHGVWIYKHPSNPAYSQAMSDIDIQQYIKKAAPYSRIKIPPGLYPSGLKINKPLTVDLAGVTLMAVSGGKGMLNIDAKDGPVTVLNFSANANIGAAQTKNLAGIRITGVDFNVTLDNVNIENTALGIMTDNRGGKLIVRNSEIKNTGRYKKRGLSHAIYAGSIDSLSINNSLIERSLHLGHLIKSRAANTEISNSRIVGLDSRHSRVVDLACGGTLKIRDSLLQSSSNSDNQDFISVGVESEKNCTRGLLNGRVDISNSLLIFDRQSHTNNKNRLFTWRTGIDHLSLNGNTFINRDGNPLLEQLIGDITLEDKAINNRLFSSRNEAGVSSATDTLPH